MSRYDAGPISGNYHDDGFYDYYSTGGKFDGAINGLLRTVKLGEHLGRYERVQSDEAVKRFSEETEVARNSRLTRKINFSLEDYAFVPNGILFPDGTYESEYTRKDWWQTWKERWQAIVEKFGNCISGQT
jgi:hypothetical protein